MEDIRPATLSGKEAAKYLGISYWLILDLAKRNQIPCIHAGTRVLFRKETLDLWMQNQEIKSMQPAAIDPVGYGTLRKV